MVGTCSTITRNNKQITKYKISIKISEEKIPLKDIGDGDNTNINLKEIRSQNVEWIYFVQKRLYWWILVRMKMIF
jgi:hypothetical protein